MAYRLASSTALYVAVIALVIGAQYLIPRWFGREDDFTQAMDTGYEWKTPRLLVHVTIVVSLIALVAVFLAVVAFIEPLVGWVFWLMAFLEVWGEGMTYWSEREFRRHPPGEPADAPSYE